MSVTVLVLGGSTRPGSSSERAAMIAAQGARNAGAQTIEILSRDLILPIYDTEATDRTPEAQRLVEAFRAADGVIVASPGYHGGISGMIKNALDYCEDLAKDEPPYLDGSAFGCVAVAYGWQATVSTLQQLRMVAHALRAWPTPLGGSINSSVTSLKEGQEDEGAVSTLHTIGAQVTMFAKMHDAAH